PSPGPYNVHLEPGEATPEELISDIAQGFYVTDLIGSGVNGVTGDYSRGASGFWIENGKITYPVSEVTIAGHLLEIFKSMVAANDLLESKLRSATPDYGWLSEESADDETRLGKPLAWIVDPIDGTRGYLAGREDWCVSAALVTDASPVLAAVFAPVSNEFFFAIRGQGATHNGVPIRSTGGTEMDFSRMAGPKPLVERLSPS